MFCAIIVMFHSILVIVPIGRIWIKFVTQLATAAQLDVTIFLLQVPLRLKFWEDCRQMTCGKFPALVLILWKQTRRQCGYIPQNHKATIEIILFKICEKKNIKHSANQTFKSFCSVIWQKNFSLFFQCFAFFIHYAWHRIELKLYFSAEVTLTFEHWESGYHFRCKLYILYQLVWTCAMYYCSQIILIPRPTFKLNAVFCRFMKLFQRDRYHVVQALENLPLIKVCFSTGSQMIDTE